MEARLAQSERLAAVGTIAEGLAHEVNNPLTYILGNLEYLETHASALPPPLPSVVRDAREGSERIARIVADLRSFARMDEVTRLEPVDVHEALEKALRMVGPALHHRARIVRRFGVAPPVRATEGRLVQVFMNLLVNATQALPPDARQENEVTLETAVSGDTVWVHVRDTGKGMSEEQKTHLFEPFFTTKPPSVGTGLGLFVSRSLVESFGGIIDVESKPGSGTTATVALPVWRGEDGGGEEGPKEEPTSSPEREKKPRVLFVDDEKNLARLFEHTLGDTFEVVVETSGLAAAERLEADPGFDAVVCDLMMPGVDGVEVFERARRAHPELAERFVFTTGGAFTRRARSFLDTVQNPCVEKPFRFSDISILLSTRIGDLHRR